MGKLYIFCAGGMGRELFELAYEINNSSAKYEEIIYVDDVIQEKYINGIKVLKSKMLYKNYESEDSVIIANGEPIYRKKIYEELKENNIKVGKLIANSAEISSDAIIESGSIIHRTSIISVGCHIDTACYINKGAIIGHDVKLGKFCVVSPGVVIGGKTVIEDYCYIGSGATIRDSIVIGKGCIVGMGSNVTKDIEKNQVVIGNPAKFMRKNISGLVF